MNVNTNVLEGTKGVPRNGGRKKQLVRSCFAPHSLHVQALMLTDVQTPFLGTPLVPLNCHAETLPAPAEVESHADRLAAPRPKERAAGEGWTPI